MSLQKARKEKCEELCRKRIAIEKMLGVRETDYEKCIKICKAYAMS
jgi:hypothetical protein